MAAKCKELTKKLELTKRDLHERLEKSIADSVGGLHSKLDKLEEATLTVVKDIRKESTEKLEGARMQVVMLRSDFQLEVKRAREELGLTVKDLPPKINMYSLSRIVEKILQHLMVHQMYSSANQDIDPLFAPSST